MSFINPKPKPWNAPARRQPRPAQRHRQRRFRRSAEGGRGSLGSESREGFGKPQSSEALVKLERQGKTKLWALKVRRALLQRTLSATYGRRRRRHIPMAFAIPSCGVTLISRRMRRASAAPLLHRLRLGASTDHQRSMALRGAF